MQPVACGSEYQQGNKTEAVTSSRTIHLQGESILTLMTTRIMSSPPFLRGREADPGLSRLLIVFLLSSLLLFLLTDSSMAGSWEPQWKFQQNVINHYLTLPKVRDFEQKALTDKKFVEKLKKATTQRVFWVGVVDEFYYQDGYSFMLLNINNDYVWAVADDTVRNLDFNRKGYTIGVKGTVVLDKKNRLYYLDVWSMVLIKAPEQNGYAQFQEKKAIPAEFLYNTQDGTYKVCSPYLPFIQHWITMHNPHYTDRLVSQMARSIVFYSQSYGVDPRLMIALFTIESAMDTDAVSWSGAVGLGQLMPATAEGLGVDPYNIIENIGGATRYLKSLMDRWSDKSDQISLSLASYNAGPGNVAKYGGIPPFSETVNYVFFINYLYKEICAQTRDLSRAAGTDSYIEKVPPAAVDGLQSKDQVKQEK